MELIIVMVILGILFSIASPSYINARRRARDREAQAMLMLIASAERMYRLEYATFFPCCTGRTCPPPAPPVDNACNGPLNLNLDLPAGPWNYNVKAAGFDPPPPPISAANTFCADAQGGGGKNDWKVDNTIDEPVIGTCP